MALSQAGETSSVAPQRATRFSPGPVFGLLFAAPLVAEYLLGNLPIKLLPALIVLAPMYGGGALLIRETVRRSRRGWPSILLLGMAYGIFEEAYTTQSLFNPDYLKLKLHLLAPAYIPTLGIGGWWTLWMLMVHGIWSISTPIALVEACVPSRARTPWTGRTGLAVIAIVFLAGAAGSTLITLRTDSFIASRAQFASAALAIAILVLLAFRIPAGHREFGQTAASAFEVKPSPGNTSGAATAWALGSVALLLASAALLVPPVWGWGAVAALLALDCLMLLAVYLLRRRGALSLRHQLALGAGAALAYGWHAFLQHPAVGTLDASVRVGNAIFLLGAIALISLGAKRTTATA